MAKKYFLSLEIVKPRVWHEVTEADFARTEQDCGFRSTTKDIVATGGFISHGICGSITYNGKEPDETC